MTRSLFSLLAVVPLAAYATDPEGTVMVGVLMDASCSAIREAGRPVTSPAAASRRPPKRTSTRSRSADSADRYENCKATPNTSEFALHTDGKLFVLDPNGNDVVRQQVRNESFRMNMIDEQGAARWLTVTVEGRLAGGDKLTIISIHR